jgi:hypothetical protein
MTMADIRRNNPVWSSQNPTDPTGPFRITAANGQVWTFTPGQNGQYTSSRGAVGTGGATGTEPAANTEARRTTTTRTITTRPTTQRGRDALMRQQRRDWEDFMLENNLQPRGLNSTNRNTVRSKDGRTFVYVNGRWQEQVDPFRSEDRDWRAASTSANRNDPRARAEWQYQQARQRSLSESDPYREAFGEFAWSGDDYNTALRRWQNQQQGQGDRSEAAFRQTQDYTRGRDTAIRSDPRYVEMLEGHQMDMTLEQYQQQQLENRRRALQARRQWEDYYAAPQRTGGFFANTAQALLSDENVKDIVIDAQRKY